MRRCLDTSIICASFRPAASSLALLFALDDKKLIFVISLNDALMPFLIASIGFDADFYAPMAEGNAVSMI